MTATNRNTDVQAAEQNSASTPDLAAHIAHLVRTDGEFRQAGICLGPSDFLIDRAREDWHRLHFRKDDGSEKMLWYKHDGDRQLVSVRDNATNYPDIAIEDFPRFAAELLSGPALRPAA